MTRGGAALALAFVTLVAAPRAEANGTEWALATASPVAPHEDAPDPLGRAALARCGAGEAGLDDVAHEILALKLAGGRLPDPDAIAFAQRAAGEPHPWARTWAASTRSPGVDGLLASLNDWLGKGVPSRRCGAASGGSRDGTSTLVVISVEALADLAPLPTRARVGQWIGIEARLHVAARSARVIVLGPSGAPRTLLSSFDRGVVRAQFAPESPGEFAVQVMADLAAGPRPVLEASVFAGVDPPQAASAAPAPGEDAAVGLRDDGDAVATMLSVARVSAGLPGLARDARLDQLALAHSSRMNRAHTLAHDAGDGSPEDRLDALGAPSRSAGENVAHAATLAQAHRALWASPSHRMNMLQPEFRRIGIGVVRGDSGDVWVTELFEGDGR
jgi:uncharacterized protein YkwD